MKATYHYFLVIAEELNITKAAKRLYISQQCLSNHLRRLEDEMNAQLFVRKPIPRLTPAGEALAKHLKTVQKLENSIHDEIAEINNNNKGHLHIGIHSSRARILLPLLAEHYGDQLSQIKINIMDGMTADFERKLQNGELDAYIGLNPPMNPEFKTYLLMKESVLLGISDILLRQYFGDRSDALLAQAEVGVDIREFENVPFIINHQDSNLTSAINVVMSQLGIHINPVFQVNGNDVHIELGCIGTGACFVPEMFVPHVEKINQTLIGAQSKMHVFRLNNFSELNRLCLVHYKEQYMFSALRTFLLLTQQLFENIYHVKTE